jgi:tetratricopeptide (TPR) repeat protein
MLRLWPRAGHRCRVHIAVRFRRARGRLAGVDINAAALRQARVAAGLSLAQVGGHDLTRQAVHLIETGKVRPSMRSLRVLAQRLEVPVASLLAPGDGDAPFDEGSIADLDRLCRHHEYDRVIERALDLLDRCRAPELVACAHYFMGQALCYTARPQEALEHLAEARELFESFDDDQGRVAETMELEALALQIAEDRRALSVATEALRRYRALDGRRPEVESRLLQRVGTILAGSMELSAALAHYQQALHVAGGVRDLVRLARLYHGLGFCHMHMGDFRSGGELLAKAHTLYEAEERLAGTGRRSDLARVENDIGILLLFQGDLSGAEPHFWSALERFDTAGHERMRSHVLLSLGDVRQRQGRPGESAELVGQAISLAARLNETQALATAHQQMAELQASLGERDAAMESFQRALDILAETGLERRHADCLAARERALGTGSTRAAGSTA